MYKYKYMQSAWYIWCVLIYDTLFVIAIFIFAKKPPNHIYQKSFYLSDGNFRHSPGQYQWYFFIYMDSNLMQTLEKYYIPKTIIYLF